MPSTKREITALAPWFGSARTIGEHVGKALEGRSWVGVPFAGGMCELRHIKASSLVVNDLHKHIINLARVVADPYSLQILRKRLQRLPFHPDTLRQAQEAASMEQWEGYEWTEWTGDIKAATAYFVSQWMGRSGKAGTDDEFSGNLSVRWNSNGGDSNTRYRSAVKSLAAWNHVMQRCNFVCMDAIDFVKKVPDDNSAAIYCDPPFPDAGDDYAVKFGEKGQVRLAAYLVQYSLTRVVCRFYDHPLIHIIQSDCLRTMIRRTLFACDIESTRYALGGVLLDFKGESVTFAATDTRRLAVQKWVCSKEGDPKDKNKSPVVPARAMSLIERTLKEDLGPVWIAVEDNHILVRSELATIYSRLVEGRFPKYQDVIPKGGTVSVNLPVGPFHAAVRQAKIVTSEESRGVDFCFAPGLLTLVSQAADVGESKVQLPIEYEGDELTITFDPRYLVEFLKILDDDKPLSLQMTNGDYAALFKTEDGYSYVIMPLSRDL